MQFDSLSSVKPDETKDPKENSANSNLDLLSVSTSDTGTGVPTSRKDIDALTDAAHQILREHSELANDKVRYFPKSLTPDALVLSDPFDKCAPELEPQDGQSSPEEIAKKNIDKLKEEISKNEKSSEKGKWQHGINLHDLAESEMYLGRYADANTHLKQSIDILRTELPNQPDREKADKAFMQASFDFGVSLIRPKGGRENPAQVIQNRQDADKAFAETLTLAHKYNEPPIQQATILREKLSNLVMLTARHDVKNPEGKAAYRQELQIIIDTYNNGLTSIGADKSNSAVASKALLTGELAFAESKRADAIGDKDAVNAVRHYDDTLKLWKEYDPKKDTTSDAQVKTRQDSVDKSLLVLLPQYYQLLRVTGNIAKADEVRKQYEEVIDRHPEIRIKN